MRRGYRIYFFFAVIISLIIPITSVVIHYSNLTEADIFCPHLCFENPDQDNIWVGHREGSRVFGLNALSDTLLLVRNLLKVIYPSFSQTPSLDQKAVVLRC